MNDIEISKNIQMKNIKEIAKKLNISDENIELYGNYKAKINIKENVNNKSKLILVTATNPTPFGEGKTTVSIGLNDALNKLNKNAICVLREPSLGPVFGRKGGATGGGYAQVVPMEDINLHFTGDFHAITSANNLLSSAIYNHIYQGNTLEIDKVTFKRCLDVNDRELREKFDITSASEMMAIFCLAKDLEDLKRRIGNITIGYTKDNRKLFAKDLNIEGALTALLKDAFKPNLVQTLEHNPVLIHGGPFANIAHGTSSIVSLKTALSLSDYVVTEAGFASELGAEKFINIVSRKLNKKPDVIILVTTLKALEYNNGFDNLDAHIDNLRNFNANIIVALNKFENDNLEDINKLKKYVESKNIDFEVITSYKDGSNGSIHLAEKIINNEEQNNIQYTYNLEDSIEEKIEKVAKNVYHASNVIYTETALEKINNIKSNYPICISKTPTSISDDPNKLGYPQNFTITVKDIEEKTGAEYITVHLNNVITMPGLPKNPNYERIDIDEQGNITGIE